MVDVKVTARLNTKCGDLLLRNYSMPTASVNVSPPSLFGSFGTFGNFYNTQTYSPSIFNNSYLDLPPIQMPPIYTDYGANGIKMMEMMMPTAQIQALFSDKPGKSFSSTNNKVNSSYSSLPNYRGARNASGLVNYSHNFLGKVNSDTEGNRLFSGGKNQDWCADFVTSCVKNVYGNNAPSWFGSSRVYYLKEQARQHNAYLELPSANKANFIAQNIKPGDIMVQLRSPTGNSSGHTGIVETVNSDGSFTVISGNSGKINGGQVKRERHSPNERILRGFIRV